MTTYDLMLGALVFWSGGVLFLGWAKRRGAHYRWVVCPDPDSPQSGQVIVQQRNPFWWRYVDHWSFEDETSKETAIQNAIQRIERARTFRKV